MTVLGPNDPRAMRRDDPRLYHPKGETLQEQVEDAVEFMVGNLTEEDYAELEAALGSALNEKENDDDTQTD
ncbi:unnamed protein product [marine sediment metagenome]|uniref:Uncharacterized protein n=1 Tax=marine sediment metagenome TaxID=412755 RepID=X0YWG5_9ZZZZ